MPITVLTSIFFGPGYHDTPAMNRLFKKKSEVEGISVEEARAAFEKQTKVGKMGDPDDFASLALWFLSPMSRYITGQTISIDGGLVKGVFLVYVSVHVLRCYSVIVPSYMSTLTQKHYSTITL